MIAGSDDARSNGRFRRIVQGDRWRCVRCGACCRSDFGEDWVDFMDPLHEFGGECPNLVDAFGRTSCVKHAERPNACRAFPFTLRKVEGDRYALMMHSGCPGFGKGRAIGIKNRISECVRLSNEELGRSRWADLSEFEKNGCVRLLK